MIKYVQKTFVSQYKNSLQKKRAENKKKNNCKAFCITHKRKAALQSCSLEKVFWKHAANIQENTHVEVRFQ